jgi:uncharacterized membrane protein
VMALARDSVILCYLLEGVLLVPLFYVYFSGRLAYTFLNAGLYLGVMVLIGRAEPGALVPEGTAMFLAIVIGVLSADAVFWLTGAESDLHIHTEGQPLLPLRREWLHRCLMLVAAVYLTQLGCNWLELPVAKATVSVMILTTTPDLQSSLRKGELRLAGALLAALWALAGFVLLALSPHFAILVGLLCLGMFVAAYVTRASVPYGYVGLQMGLVLPLLLVVPASEFGSLIGARQRLEGILVALGASLVVGAIWPWGAAPAATTPVPSR